MPHFVKSISFKQYWHLRLSDKCSGQGTVEFAVVTAAVLAIIVAIGCFLNMTDSGMLISHAVASASHNVSGAMLGIVGDVFCV